MKTKRMLLISFMMIAFFTALFDSAAAKEVNLEAYKYYILGRFFRTQQTQTTLAQARECFERAITIDPEFAAAHAWLGRVQSGDKGTEALNKALALDSTCADALLFMSRNKYNQSNWNKLQQDLKAILADHPETSEAHYHYGLLLMRTGKIEHAIIEFERNIELEPFSCVAYSYLSQCYFYAAQYQKAIETAHKALELNDAFGVTYHTLVNTYLWLDQYENAQKQLEEASARNKLVAWQDFYSSLIAAKSGDTEKALGGLALLKKAYTENENNLIAVAIARISSLVGDKTQALDWLKKTKPGLATIEMVNNSPDFNTLRQEPRFQAVQQKMMATRRWIE
ncbi:hypothetical protein EH223_13415 [candidate division KSB1 bacterium]|nr:tetratricopeptide repeat protein [candidate division KSB1 bacterium]RQW02047.1 MAG: hypothetical protein EH223_13415 [candidate division KSB1 bacterium]